MPKYKQFFRGKFYERDEKHPSLEKIEREWIEANLDTFSNRSLAKAFRIKFNKDVSYSVIRRIRNETFPKVEEKIIELPKKREITEHDKYKFLCEALRYSCYDNLSDEEKAFYNQYRRKYGLGL